MLNKKWKMVRNFAASSDYLNFKGRVILKTDFQGVDSSYSDH